MPPSLKQLPPSLKQLPPEVDPTAEDFSQCTCNRCIDGWLSPRMHCLLLEYATEAVQLLSMSLPEFELCDTITMEEALDIHLIEYIPTDVRFTVHHKFCLGWKHCFVGLKDVLQAKKAPYSEHLVTAMFNHYMAVPEVSKFYFQQGGCVEYAMDAILACAEQHQLKKSFANEGPGAWISQNINKRLDQLPPCSNDDQYGIIREILFADLDMPPPEGPYHSVACSPQSAYVDDYADDYISDSDAHSDCDFAAP